MIMATTGCKPTDSNPQTLRYMLPFEFGAAMDPTLLTDNAAYRQVAGREYSSITTENYLKMGLVHPAPDLYVWTGSDILVNFAEQNNQRVHGHTLIWHHSIPDWVTNFKGDSTAWEGLFKRHIQQVISHYGNRVMSWDVVNEALDDDGKILSTIWSIHLGTDYIARAFRYAREANPNVKLFYNDFGYEYNSKRLAAGIALAADFKQRGIPIDGLGVEMHTHIARSDSSIENVIKEMTKTGLLVHISELEVRVNQTNLPNYVITDADVQQQRQKYAAIVRAYRTTVPKAQQHGITTWNVGDADSWVTAACNCPDFPLPFDKQYAKKIAYDGILDGIK